MNLSELSDEQLVDRLKERDTDAFAALYDRYSRKAFGLAYRLLNDAAAAEDVVQEAFLSLWRQAETFRPGRAALHTWLLSIVHHRAVDRLRRVDNRAIADGMRLDAVADRLDEQVNVEEEVSLALTGQQMRGALRDLPAEQRTVIELAYFGGLSHREIAARLQIPSGTVKGRIRIGLQKLRVALGETSLQGAPVTQQEQHRIDTLRGAICALPTMG